MIGYRELRAGSAVLLRHLRRSEGRFERLWWIIRRATTLLVTGRLGTVLQRSAVVEDLYADYPRWIDEFDTIDSERWRALERRVSALLNPPLISILMPTRDADPAALKLALASVSAQIYPHWQLSIADDASEVREIRGILERAARADPRIHLMFRREAGGIAAATNSALEHATGDFVAFLDQDDTLSPDALLRVAEAIGDRPGLELLYSDEDLIDKNDLRHSPHFKPDWNTEWIKTSNYMLHLVVVRAATVRRLGGLREGIDGAQDWDMVLRVSEFASSEQIVHVPRILYHWRVLPGSTAAGTYHKSGVVEAQKRVLLDMLQRRRIEANLERAHDSWRIRYKIPLPAPLISIVVLTRDNAALLRSCLSTIVRHTSYANFEVIVVNHNAQGDDCARVLNGLDLKNRSTLVDYRGVFNYAKQCNTGVAHARGEVVLLLNDDVQAIQAGWLSELVGIALQPGTGVVGAMLLYPDDTIQHAGVILGLNGIADRPYAGLRRGFSGIVGRALVAQDVSAVVTACAAIRKAVYQQAGGMNEALAVSNNDLDLCLRVSRLGYRNKWTPFSALVHEEGATRGYGNAPAELQFAKDEAARFIETWGPNVLEDPFYNRNLSRTGKPYSLAYPPRFDG